MIKFVRVKFKNSSKLYDYICELDNVQKGDFVYVNTTYDNQQPSENNNDDSSVQKKNTLQDKICLLFLYAPFALYVVMFIWGLFTEEGARARAFMQDLNDFSPRR